MRTSRTYYEILGLARGASSAQIKRRYKQLVRRYHPDVAADKATAHRLFIQIREAYETLSDPARRRAYDATLEMGASRQSSSRASVGSTAARAQSVPASRHVKDAQWAFIQKRFQQAAAYCREALRVDGRSSQAYAILGDIYRAQGKIDGAIKYYSYAVQYNPNDRDTQKKLTGLMDRRVGVPTRRARPVPSAKRLPALNMMGWAVAFFLIMLIGVIPGLPIPWLATYIPPVSKWSWNLVGLMAAASVVVGVLLALNRLVSHPDEELVLESGGANWAVVPTGLALLVGSGFFFLGAAGFYLVVGFIQGSISKSVMTVFGCVALVVSLSALMYDQSARTQVLLFGGNVAFLSMLIGWYIGAMIRPLGEY